MFSFDDGSWMGYGAVLTSLCLFSDWFDKFFNFWVAALSMI